MSRIGVQPIAVPSGVEVKIQPGNVEVKGPKGELSQAYDPDITIEQDGDVLTVKRPTDSKDHKSKHGLVRALLANMVNNCANGYSKELEIQGVGYRAAMKGKNIELSVGYSHPVMIEPPEGVTIECPQPTQVIVSGADKQAVGEIAARIRKTRPPEPYKGKGIRYKGEHVQRKVGKRA
ncbi:MAG: 50S ribosomal protein L6 [Thermoleophilaceae bacterium]|nr:50S ribosomal protein L6 [Thermoleophilaceae bacterium]